jgi:hypothetical protein
VAHQRNPVLLGDVHGDGGVRRTGAAADEGDAGPAGDLGVAYRHEPGAALVPAYDGLDGVAVMQGIQRREVAFARDAEHAVDAVGGETVNEKVRSATSHVHLRILSRR